MKAYAIKDPKGEILPWHISFYAGQTRAKFIVDWVHNLGMGWKQLYNMGYRCVPVEITEIKQEK